MKQAYPYVDKNKNGEFVVRTSDGNCLRASGKTVIYPNAAAANAAMRQWQKSRDKAAAKKPAAKSAAKKPAPAPAAKKAVPPPAKKAAPTTTKATPVAAKRTPHSRDNGNLPTPAATGGDSSKSVRNYDRASLDAKLEARWRAKGWTDEQIQRQREKNAQTCLYTRQRRAKERAEAAAGK